MTTYPRVNKNQFDSYIQWFEFIEDSAIVKSRNKGKRS